LVAPWQATATPAAMARMTKSSFVSMTPFSLLLASLAFARFAVELPVRQLRFSRAGAPDCVIATACLEIGI
jgi:hypothetical protein